jgi:hypothetical protein
MMTSFFKVIPNYSNIELQSLKNDVIWINDYLKYNLILDIKLSNDNQYIHYEMAKLDSEQSLKWLEEARDENSEIYYTEVILFFIKVFLDTLKTNSSYVDIGGDHLFTDTDGKRIVIDWDDFLLIKDESIQQKVERFKKQLKNKCIGIDMYKKACKELKRKEPANDE